MKTFVLMSLIATLTVCSAFAQSKEQREAAQKWAISFRINPEKGESKSHKDSGGNKKTQVKTQERTMNWTATVDCKSTNFTEKVEIKTYYVGTTDGEFTILGSDTLPVKFDEKGRSSIKIASPTAKLVKTTKRKGGRRNSSTEKTVKGDRINGLVAQLLVNGTIVKTYTTQPVWAKGAWKADLSEDDIRPGAKPNK